MRPKLFACCRCRCRSWTVLGSRDSVEGEQNPQRILSNYFCLYKLSGQSAGPGHEAVISSGIAVPQVLKTNTVTHLLTGCSDDRQRGERFTEHAVQLQLEQQS